MDYEENLLNKNHFESKLKVKPDKDKGYKNYVNRTSIESNNTYKENNFEYQDHDISKDNNLNSIEIIDRRTYSINSNKNNEFISKYNNNNKNNNSCCCCCFTCFGCKCCSQKTKKGRSYYIRSWKKYLEKEKFGKHDPFSILTNLWAHKNVINDLENIRINPNLLSEFRTDIEFYIPQLCSFLVFGMSEATEEFVAFLCKASYASFYFAHRVLWFLSSFDLDNINLINKVHSQKIKVIINILVNLFNSEKDKEKVINLYLPNSLNYLSMLNENNLLFLYQKRIIKSNLNNKQLNCLKIIEDNSKKVKEFDEAYEIIQSKIKERKNTEFSNNSKNIINSNITKSESNKDNIKISNKLCEQNSRNSLFVNKIKSLQVNNISTNDLNSFYQDNKIENNHIFIKLFPDLNNDVQVISYHVPQISTNSSIIEEKDYLDSNSQLKHDNLKTPNDNKDKNYNSNVNNSFNHIDENSINKNTNSKEESLKNKAYKSNINDNNNNNINHELDKNIDDKGNTNNNFLMDVNLLSFKSTLNFYNSLCCIGEKVGFILDKTSAMNYLKSQLIELNEYLPANVYIPFIKTRSYAVCHISVSESRIFKTKNRAPYLIVLELFRPEELSQNYSNKSNLINKNVLGNKLNNSNSSLSKNRNSYDTKMMARRTYSARGSSYSNRSMSFNENNKKNTKKGLIKNGSFGNLKNNKENANYFKNFLTKSFGSSKIMKINNKTSQIRSPFDTYQNILENDVQNSKPIQIKSINRSNSINNKNQTKLVKENKIILEEDEDLFSMSKKKYMSPPVVYSNRFSNNLINDNKALEIYNEKDWDDRLKREITNSLGINSNINMEETLNICNKPGSNLNLNFGKKRSLTYNSSSSLPLNKSILENNDKFNENNKNDNFEIKINDMNTIVKNNTNKNLEEEADVNKLDKKNIKDNSALNVLNKFNIEYRHNLMSSLKHLFGETFDEMHKRLSHISPYGNLKSFKLFKMIIKSGEDLRQEQFTTQLINEFSQIFALEKLDLVLNKYEIIATGNKVGVIECINDAISIDELHKKTGLSLKEFFNVYYSSEFNFSEISKKQAKLNFIKSFAAYCLVCYFLQIKDRHNANIMIDRQGYISHIDFGFMLSNAPGKGLEFEKAPFKLTNDILELMEGVNSKYFEIFRKLLWKGFYYCVKHSSKIIVLVEMMYCGHGSTLPCFEKGILIKYLLYNINVFNNKIIIGDLAIYELKNRFFPKPSMKASDYLSHVDKLIEASINNWRTKWYDKYQYYVQGILY